MVEVDTNQKIKKIIYFDTLISVIPYAKDLVKRGYRCFIDSQCDESLFQTIIHVDSDITEQAISFLFKRLKTASEFESTIIHSQLLTHYPRIFRCQYTFSQGSHNKIAYFIPKEKINIFDLAFSVDSQCEYEQLTKNDISLFNLNDLVKFYEPKNISKYDLKLDFFTMIRKKITNAFYFFKKVDKKILFLVHDNEANLYLKPLISVFLYLRKLRIDYLVLSLDKNARSLLIKENIPYIELEDILNRDHSPKYNNQTQENWFVDLISKYPVKSGNCIYDKLYQISFNTSVCRDLWENNLLVNELYYYIIKSDVTDIFFVPDGTLVASKVSHLIQSSKIKSHTLLAAGISNYKRTIGYYFAKNIYCAGENAATCLKNHLPSHNIILVGNPSLHRYVSQQENFALTKEKIIILIATSSFDPLEILWISDLVSKIRSEKYKIILKPHPSYPDKYDSLKDISRHHLILDSNSPIEPIVMTCDIVITDHSQVGIDAHLLGKNVISMYQGSGDILYMKNIGSILYVNNVSDLLIAIDDCSQKKPMIEKEFIKSFNKFNDTHYYKRIVENLIYD